MERIVSILKTLIMLPFNLLKWTFYCIFTYALLFGTGLVIDKYIGWHPSLKPIRDNTLRITIGLLEQTTPYLEQLALKVEKKKNTQPELNNNIQEEDNPMSIDKTTIKKDILAEAQQSIDASMQILTKSLSGLEDTINNQPKGFLSPQTQSLLIIINTTFLALCLIGAIYYVLNKGG